MSASVVKDITDTQKKLLEQEKALVKKMQEGETQIQDLLTKDGWSDDDNKKHKELSEALTCDTEQYKGIQNQLKSAQSKIDMHKSRELESKTSVDRKSIIGQIDQFIRFGSRNKLSEGDEEALHKSSEMADFYEAAKNDFGSANMCRIQIPEESISRVINGRALGSAPRATITTDGRTSESDAGAEDDTGAGYSDYATTTTETLDTNIIWSLLAWGGMGRHIRTITTANGNPYRFPRIDPGNATGEWIGLGHTTGSDAHYTSPQRKAATVKPVPSSSDVTLNAHLVSSGIVSFSLVAAQDSLINIEAIAIDQMTRRIGRSLADKTTKGMTTEVNSAQERTTPIGVMTFAGDGGTSRAAGKVDWEDLFRMVNKIDAAYLMNSETTDMRSGGLTSLGGQASFMMTRDVEQAIMLERDSDNRPIWIQNLATGNFNMLRGYPYFLNFNMDPAAAASKSVVFGLFNHYVCRVVREIVLFRMADSAYSSKYSVGLVQFGRFDGYHVGPVDAAGKAVAYKALTTKS